MCYATLLCRQDKKVLKCPRSGCHGWKDFEQQSSSEATYKVWDPTAKLRLLCNVCGFREYIPGWTCYKCAMPQSHCFCEIPKTAKTQSARKRPAAALPSQVMPATKRTATWEQTVRQNCERQTEPLLQSFLLMLIHKRDLSQLFNEKFQTTYPGSWRDNRWKSKANMTNQRSKSCWW